MERSDKAWVPLVTGLGFVGLLIISIIVTGERAAELALRFTYAGFDADRLEVVPGLRAALYRGLELVPAGGELAVLPTYTAMLDLRAIAVERGLARPYWEGVT